jgi:AAA family ATP:ADP antiporter
MKTWTSQAPAGAPTKRPSPIYRLLRIFTVILPGEAPTALLLTANVFMLLIAYYILKPIREALFLSKFSPELKSILGAAQAFLLIFVVKIFSRIASKAPRQILITRVTAFFISNLVLFYILHLANLSGKAIGIIYFIWVGIFNLMVIAQFWAFANDIYSEDVGRRLFPLVAFGATFGGMVGSILSTVLEGKQTVYQMMLVAAGFLGLCILLTFIVHRREIRLKAAQRPVPFASPEKQVPADLYEKPLEKGGGFRLLWKNHYLIYIAFFVLLLNFVNTNGQYILDRVVKPAAIKAAQEAPYDGPDRVAHQDQVQQQFIAKFFSGYNLIQNLWTMLIQLFLVSRIFKWFGVRAGIFFLPLIALGGYIWVTAGASLVIVKWVKALENGADYSIMNTTRHALFLVTTREEKYKAKAAIDTFFQRLGDTLSTTLIVLNMLFFSLKIEAIAFINVLALIPWLIMGGLIFRTHKRLTAKTAGHSNP